MNDALVKLRDYAERRVYPACQRLLVVLQDVRGWSQLCVQRSMRVAY